VPTPGGGRPRRTL